MDSRKGNTMYSYDEAVMNVSERELVLSELPTEDEIGEAIDSLHTIADEVDRLRSIPAFRVVCLSE
jgi:hypothetical protein